MCVNMSGFGMNFESFTEQDEYVRQIYKILLSVGGNMKYRALKRRMERSGKFQNLHVDYLMFMRTRPNNFKIETDESRRHTNYNISPTSKIRYCSDHCSKNSSCVDPLCDSLHLCKFYFNGTCKFGENCNFGHDIWNAHNRAALHAHQLDALSEKEIGAVLLGNVSTLPRICTWYNSKGCSKKSSCSFLHVCKYYIQGTCTFGTRCKRSHNIYDPQPREILSKNGIDLSRMTPGEIVAKIQEAGDSDLDSESRSSGQHSLSSSPRRGTPRGGATGQQVVYPLLSPRRKGGQASATKSRLPVAPPSPKVVAQTGMKKIGKADSFEDMCTFDLRGKCNYGQKCRKFHNPNKLPYHWAFRHMFEGSEWIDLSRSEVVEIEKKYCDPGIDEVTIGQGRTFCFSTMTVKEGRSHHKLRRLSTRSSTTATEATMRFATQWVWYWKDENGQWIEYGKQAGQHHASNLASDKIEDAFMEDKFGQLDFETSYHKYILDFQLMIQKNIKFKTERDVKRRPVYVSPEAFGQAIKRPIAKHGLGTPGTEDGCIPANWDTTAAMNSDAYQLVRLPSDQEEFIKVKKDFLSTMPQHTICSIERIQNLEIWDSFSRKKEWMKKKLSSGDVEERHLFHGTRKEYIDAICQQGFDPRISGMSSGTMYGKGTYFATTADYSRNYTDCKKMIYARVLVGTYVEGKRDFVRPPPKNPSKPHGELYDSCVNSRTAPSIFVIFKPEQIYPEYLITYA